MVFVEVTDEYHPQSTQLLDVPLLVTAEVPLELEERAHPAVHHDGDVSHFTQVYARHVAVLVTGTGGTAQHSHSRVQPPTARRQGLLLLVIHTPEETQCLLDGQLLQEFLLDSEFVIPVYALGHLVGEEVAQVILLFQTELEAILL